jgi:subtilisin family serine protease
MSVGVGTPATYAECFEFFLAPYPVGTGPEQGDPSKAPDVINNSWTCPPPEGCDAEHTAFLREVVESVRAAGILVVASAGNSGSGCSTIVDPPAEFDAALSVGATSSAAGDPIAGFSSRGPVGSLVKPDLAAPGVGVYSSYPNGTYGTSSGTSMAAPHVVGAAALLMSANPDLRGDVAAIERILTDTSVPRIDMTCSGAPGGVPNNVYGWGRLDSLSALQLGHLTGIVQDPMGAPVKGAMVEIRHTSLRLWRSSSGDGGGYHISPISGTYTVTVALNGALAAYAGVHVTAGQTTTLDVTLPVPCAAVAGADLRMTPSEPWIGETVRVTGSITSASLPVTYTWDFGEGDPVRTGNPVPHTYETLPISQTYTLVMTATNRCSSARVTRDVAIRSDRWYLPLLFKASL